MSAEPIRHPLSWADVEVGVATLADQYACRKTYPKGFERIVAVARGGMIPAVMLAHRLDVPIVESVQIQGYNGTQRQKHLVILGPVPARSADSGHQDTTLVVDDITDSGRTLELLKRHFPHAHHCTLVGRKKEDPAAILIPDAWVVFPWEPR